MCRYILSLWFLCTSFSMGRACKTSGLLELWSCPSSPRCHVSTVGKLWKLGKIIEKVKTKYKGGIRVLVFLHFSSFNVASWKSTIIIGVDFFKKVVKSCPASTDHEWQSLIQICTWEFIDIHFHRRWCKVCVKNTPNCTSRLHVQSQGGWVQTPGGAGPNGYHIDMFER